MKKLFKRRGFTLVEVMVAFVIFAIMAAMVAAILNSTMAAKRENTDLEGEIVDQQSKYYLYDHEKKYDESKKSGTIVLDFKDSEKLSMDYSMEDVNSDTNDGISLAYVVGNVNYDSSGDNDSDKKGDGNLVDALDSRIFGTNKIEEVYVKCKDLGEADGGYRYMFSVMVSAPDIEGNDRYFAQVRFRFPGNVLNYGYIGTGDSIKGKNENVEYNVTCTSEHIIRLGSKMPAGKWGSKNDPMLTANYKKFWVSLSEPIDPDNLNETFGYSDSDQTANKSGDTYTFTPYKEKVTENGTTSITEHVNIFGAFPNDESEEPSDGTGESGETSES